MDNFFKKIKVGVLNDHFDQLGGGTTHSFKILEFLKKYYDVEVFIPRTAKEPEWIKSMLNMNLDGVKFYPYQKGIGKKYDYMFLNVSHWKAEETNAFKKFMIVFFPQFFFPTFDYHLLANSEYTKKNILKRWNKKSEQVSVLYPPIQTEKFTSGEKKNIILHVSRLASPRPEADKGHLQMIQAFKEMNLKDWEFHIVGEPQDMPYYKTLRSQAGNAKIVFHEKATFNKLRQLYSQAKIYWHMTGISMPNEAGAQEHFGMTIVEAMASGCVPVVFNSGGPKEIIENGVSGILVDDIRDLQQNTKALTRNRGLLEEMSVNAMERSKTFDEKEIEQQFYNLVAKTNKVSIIMIGWNNSKFTKECVDRLYEVTPKGFQLILVDNASDDNTWKVMQDLEKKYPNIKAIHSDKNLGFAGGNNLGLKQATGEYICFLNNDTLPQWGWLEQMIDVLETDEDAAIVGARLYFPEKNGKWTIQHAGVEFKTGMVPKHIGRFVEDSLVSNRGIEEVEAVTGACMLVRRKFAKFNETFERGYYEDTDMCLRVREAGFKVLINHDAKLIHYEGTSQDILKKKDKVGFDAVSKKNLESFNKIWKDKFKDLPKIKKTTMKIREGKKVTGVEIGGGETPLYPNYEQVDLRPLKNVKYQNDARVLPFPENSIKHLVACYVLQCMNRKQAEIAIREWYRVLEPGGQLEIHVPDIRIALKAFSVDEEEKWLTEIYGEQKHELDYYKTAWTFDSLDKLLSKINFVRVGAGSKPKHRQNAISITGYKSYE